MRRGWRTGRANGWGRKSGLRVGGKNSVYGMCIIIIVLCRVEFSVCCVSWS